MIPFWVYPVSYEYHGPVTMHPFHVRILPKVGTLVRVMLEGSSNEEGGAHIREVWNIPKNYAS